MLAFSSRGKEKVCFQNHFSPDFIERMYSEDFCSLRNIWNRSEETHQEKSANVKMLFCRTQSTQNTYLAQGLP